MPPEATPRGAEISWGPFLVPYGGTYHELFLPGGGPRFFVVISISREIVILQYGARRRDHGKSNVFPTRATYHWGRVPVDFWPGWLPGENLQRT